MNQSVDTYNITLVQPKSGRSGFKETVKRIKVIFTLNNVPEAILSRFSDFALLGSKFNSLRWTGEILFIFSDNKTFCRSVGLEVVSEDGTAFLQNIEVILASLRSLSLLNPKGFELSIRVTAKRR